MQLFFFLELFFSFIRVSRMYAYKSIITGIAILSNVCILMIGYSSVIRSVNASKPVTQGAPNPKN